MGDGGVGDRHPSVFGPWQPGPGPGRVSHSGRADDHCSPRVRPVPGHLVTSGAYCDTSASGSAQLGPGEVSIPLSPAPGETGGDPTAGRRSGGSGPGHHQPTIGPGGCLRVGEVGVPGWQGRHPDHRLAGGADQLAPRLVDHLDEILTGEAVECSGLARRRPLPHTSTLGPAPPSGYRAGWQSWVGTGPRRSGASRRVVTEHSWCLNRALIISWYN